MESGRNPDGKTHDSADGLCLSDSVDGLGVSINGKEAFGGGGFVGLFDLNRNGIDCVSVKDSEIDPDRDTVKEMDFDLGVEDLQEVVGGDFDVVADADPAVGPGVVEGEDSRIMEVEDEPEGGNVLYSIGDFVWGKIKNHTWFPGQIHDPSDASESAAKHDQKGKFLVAFTDGSFAWCHSSQLKPFGDDFEEMLKQGSSKRFVSAVDNALSDIGKLVELEMSCWCVLKGNQELCRPLADNTGIKDGVLIPERGSNCSITEFEPVEFVANLKNIAPGASVVGVVDLLMLKSRVCAFYRAKGSYRLPEYYEPQQVPGLEDKMELDIVIHDGDMEVPAQGSFEEMVQPRVVRVKAHLGPRSGRKKRKATCEANGGQVSEDDWRGSENGAKKRGRKKRRDYISSDSDSGEEVSEDGHVQTETRVASRVRKRSKYLSPPYTDLFQGPQKEDSESESEQIVSVDHGSLHSSRPVPMTIELPVSDILSEIRSVALFAQHPDEKANDSVMEFLYKYRNSTYVEGSHHNVYEEQPREDTKCLSSPKRRGRKRKSMNSEANQNGNVESPGSASLFVTFGPGSSLPTKDELIALYKNFGDLVENETDVFYNSFCACVVFVRASDAEKAFKSSQDSSPFGTGNVTFRLRNTLAETGPHPKASCSPNRRIKTSSMSSASEAHNGEALQQNCLEEKVEMMVVMAEQ